MHESPESFSKGFLRSRSAYPFWPASAKKTLVFTPKHYGVVFMRKWVTRFFGQKYIILKYINYLEILNGIRPIAHQSIFVR